MKRFLVPILVMGLLVIAVVAWIWLAGSTPQLAPAPPGAEAAPAQRVDVAPVELQPWRQPLADVFSKHPGNPKAVAEALAALAEAGDARAQYELGCRYRRGHGVALNPAKAYSLLQAASDRSGEASLELGRMYANGELGEKKGKGADFFAKAQRSLEIAAAKGDAEAQYHLASMYLFGEGCDKDEAKAITLYQRAARAGVPMAQIVLKDMNRTW